MAKRELKSKNIFKEIPKDVPFEIFEELISSKKIRIERIVSKGHSSPEDFWYDQKENEWVMVLKGEAAILFANELKEIVLKEGDFINIPAGTKHRVEWTKKNSETIWLCVFY